MRSNNDLDLALTSGTDDTRNMNGDGVNNTEDKSESTLAGRESRQLKYLGVFFGCLFVLAAAAISASLFYISRSAEIERFETQYDSRAQKVIDTFHASVDNKLGAMEALSLAFTSYAKAKGLKFPHVTLPDFHVRGASTRALADALSVSFLPLVTPSTRASWEEYSRNNLHWVQQGNDFEAIHFGSNEASRNLVLGDGVISEEVYSVFEDNKINLFGKGPFFPLWQSSPVLSELINLDLRSDENFRDGINAMIASKQAVIGEVSDLEDADIVLQTFQDAWASQPQSSSYAGDPVSKMYFPVFEALGNTQNGTMVGMLTAVLFWETYFLDILQPHTPALIVVLHNDCGQTYTYQLEGKSVIYVGPGDRHDDKFNGFRRTTTLFGFHDKKKYTIGLNDFCHYSLRIYPTEAMHKEFVTATPIFLVVVSLVIFAFSAILIVAYNWAVERRQRMVMKKAVQAGAIVSSIFPAAVRERLFHGSPDNSRNNNPMALEQSIQNPVPPHKSKFGSLLRDDHRGFGAAQQKDHESGDLGLGDIVGGGDDDPDEGDDSDVENGQVTSKTLANNLTERTIPKSMAKAIADTFPDATIMFSDIIGFTAWSSEREPGEVFTLLQTIYQEFDTLARKLQVFKVETVGDSYVAATGLPDPQSDHAVRMARFAGLCMMRMMEVVRDLEVSLGPDTGDLRMRIGIHSGPVTAGVLRGEKSRFQIFGDTVNTAARMETNAVKNRIQCSEATAELLIEAGKEHWIRKREDLVKAKGKGMVQTYWVLPRSGATSIISAEEDNAANANDYVKDLWSDTRLVFDLTSQNNRYQRLIDWNVELLAALLKQIAASRKDAKQKIDKSNVAPSIRIKGGSTAVDEVTEIIALPQFDKKSIKRRIDPNSIDLGEAVYAQLRDYVTTVASMYKSNAFHNFEHASHVTMSTNKLLKRVVAPEALGKNPQISAMDLHDYTFGITSDPVTQFALVFSALIHDVDHDGVPNYQLIAENAPIARLYKGQSIAEQNSVDISWDLLMDPSYKDLQKAIYSDTKELERFRQLIVNIVLATDIFDKNMKSIRERRWGRAFQYEADEDAHEDEKDDCKSEHALSTIDGANLKATIVMEHLIQASDVAHTMQHWDIYLKWNERLFTEMHKAWKLGRSSKDPALGWYEGEIIFFDKYIIPLAKKLAECGVFGVSSDEYLNYAMMNRKQWAVKGDAIVAEFSERAEVRYESEQK